MTPQAERRALQIVVAVVAIIPVDAGLSGALFGHKMIEHLPGTVSEDSHVRYLSGLLLAIGVAWWAAIPRIEHHTARIRLLTALVVCGGLARLIGLIIVGVPSKSMLAALFVELMVTPAVALWQARVARRL